MYLLQSHSVIDSTIVDHVTKIVRYATTPSAGVWLPKCNIELAHSSLTRLSNMQSLVVPSESDIIKDETIIFEIPVGLEFYKKVYRESSETRVT